MRVEEECEELKEIALARKEKQRLRRAWNDMQKVREIYGVDVSEVFSPPRITKEAENQKLVTGGAYDLKTGFNLSRADDRARMWRELKEDEPELVVGSPPCTAFFPTSGAQLQDHGARDCDGQGDGWVGAFGRLRWKFANGKMTMAGFFSSSTQEHLELSKKKDW